MLQRNTHRGKRSSSALESPADVADTLLHFLKLYYMHASRTQATRTSTLTFTLTYTLSLTQTHTHSYIHNYIYTHKHTYTITFTHIFTETYSLKNTALKYCKLRLGGLYIL